MRQIRFAILVVCAAAMLVCAFQRDWARDPLVGLGPMGAETCTVGMCRPEPGALIVGSVSTLGYLAIAGAVAAAIGCIFGALKPEKRLNAVILAVAGLLAFIAFEFAVNQHYEHLAYHTPFFVAVIAAVLAATALLVQPRRGS
ncbi:MAG: hypothetical protein QM831_42615 [Kofleriaceae bacterium]